MGVKQQCKMCEKSGARMCYTDNWFCVTKGNNWLH